MARPFDNNELKRIISTHGSVISRLSELVSLKEKYSDDVISSVNRATVAEVLKLLRETPVEELNRDKNGVRVSLLKDNNINTVADLVNVSPQQLSGIHGISYDSAVLIRSLADSIISGAVENVKIRINADNKTPDATKLLSSIYRYRNCDGIVGTCRKIYDGNIDTVKQCYELLKPARSALSWTFSSSEKKRNALEAYNTLKSMLNGAYLESVGYYNGLAEKLESVDSDTVWEDFGRNSIQYYNIIEAVNPDVIGNSDTYYGLPKEIADEIKDTDIDFTGLKCELRRYQEFGAKYILKQGKVLLGDEMGLGKTVQAIAAMVALRNLGATHFMVVCPASVITNWCREIVKHSDLEAVRIHGADREANIIKWKENGGIAITTYETCSAVETVNDVSLALIVVDEAHYIKNPQALRTKKVYNLCKSAQRVLFMTGTALENKVDEMVRLISMLQPEIASKAMKMTFMASAPQFREMIAPVYYRRKREDVLTELPELLESEEWCDLKGKEEAIYEESVLQRKYSDARRVSWNVDDLADSSKALRMSEIIAQAKSEGRKVIVFSYFLDTIRKIKNYLGDDCTEPICGSVPVQRRQEIIDEFDNAEAGKVLVAQIQSGGTGLNIQSASVVIICEPQFKPSTENQAISRAYRMGQTRNVLVYRLLSENTVDERLTEVLSQKQAVFDAFADKSFAADNDVGIDEKKFSSIMESEYRRILERQSSAQSHTKS